MEMIFKLTEGKPPFIGVIYKDIGEAKINMDLLEYKSAKFSIMVLGYGGAGISFRIYSDKPNVLREYNNVKYDFNLFKAWRVYTHHKINFGHVLMNGNKPEIVRINGKMFVIPIEYFITD